MIPAPVWPDREHNVCKDVIAFAQTERGTSSKGCRCRKLNGVIASTCTNRGVGARTLQGDQVIIISTSNS